MSILQEIVEHKKRWVLANSHLEKSITFDQNIAQKKSLLETLNEDKKIFILEVKPASPTKDKFLHGSSIKKVLQAYEPFADCISVLADEKYFKGSLENVELAAKQSIRPILCKDIIISSLQIKLAKKAGANAVLLMLSILSDSEYLNLQQIAQNLQLDVICEVHDEEELARALKLKPKILGINNRDLKTLQIDLRVCAKLAKLVPKNIKVIAESGINNALDVNYLWPHANGFLIGSSLMSAHDLDVKIRELVFSNIKICGITSMEDAYLSFQKGASFLGLNFCERSKRHIKLDEALNIIKFIGPKYIGIFVDQNVDEVLYIAHTLNLHAVQLHGSETKSYIEDLRQKLDSKIEIWQNYNVKQKIIQLPMLSADRLVFDAPYKKGLKGGSGRSFDWSLLPKKEILQNHILAGGIDENNCLTARLLSPYIIDIASGSETKTPKKCEQKLTNIFAKLNGSSL